MTPAAGTPHYVVVLPAAGVGSRMGAALTGGRRKSLVALAGRPILHHVLGRLRAAPGCTGIVPVLHPDDCARADLVAELRDAFGIGAIARGGATRQESVMAGLELVGREADLVLIHDAARPLVETRVVQAVAVAAQAYGAAIAAVPVTDTVKEADDEGVVRATLDRSHLWLAQTPQGFRRDLILRAHRAAREDGFLATDDAQLVTRLGAEVRLVRDTRDNLKITTAEDLAIAEAILRWRGR